MDLILEIVGIGIIGISVIFGIMSGELMFFFTSVISGGISSLLFFGLSKVLSNQERIIQLHNSNLGKTNYITHKEVVCYSCGKSYGNDRTSCPYCGNRA